MFGPRESVRFMAAIHKLVLRSQVLAKAHVRHFTDGFLEHGLSPFSIQAAKLTIGHGC